MDRVFGFYAGCLEFNSTGNTYPVVLFQSKRQGNPHPECSELENNETRVTAGDSSVTERRWWRPPFHTSKTEHEHTKYNTHLGNVPDIISNPGTVTSLRW